MKTIYTLTHEGKTLHRGEENSCYIQLQKVQSLSADRAIRHEGYKIEPQQVTDSEAAEILKADKYAETECRLLQNWEGYSNQRLKAECEGQQVIIDTYATRPVTGTQIGDTVKCMNLYISNL